MSGKILGLALRFTIISALVLAVSVSASDGLVYQGRAVFEQVQPAVIPKPFIGAWAQDLKWCKAKAIKGRLSIMARTIVSASAKMPVQRVLLNPRQYPNYNRAIIETGNAGTGDTLILQLSGSSSVTVTVRGQSGTTRYQRCN